MLSRIANNWGEYFIVIVIGDYRSMRGGSILWGEVSGGWHLFVLCCYELCYSNVRVRNVVWQLWTRWRTTWGDLTLVSSLVNELCFHFLIFVTGKTLVHFSHCSEFAMFERRVGWIFVTNYSTGWVESWNAGCGCLIVFSVRLSCLRKISRIVPVLLNWEFSPGWVDQDKTIMFDCK